jgi:hypothetical protein
MRDRPSTLRLVLVPALITLAVTLLRLTGELLHWNEKYFNREAGGGGALVGIVWLIPLFGAWFGLRLADAGETPPRLGRALGWAAMAFMFNTATGIGSFVLFPDNPVAQLSAFTVFSFIAIAIAYGSWPALWKVLLAYGIAARLPVLVIMYLSIFGGWDTHYAKPRPDFPAMGPWGLFFWTALLPQGSIWIYLTIVLGLIFGAVAVGLRALGGRRRSESAAATTPGPG